MHLFKLTVYDCKQTGIATHTHMCNAVLLVWGSLRLAPIAQLHCIYTCVHHHNCTLSSHVQGTRTIPGMLNRLWSQDTSSLGRWSNWEEVSSNILASLSSVPNLCFGVQYNAQKQNSGEKTIKKQKAWENLHVLCEWHEDDLWNWPITSWNYPPPFYHTTLRQKWGGDICLNVPLVLCIRPPSLAMLCARLAIAMTVAKNGSFEHSGACGGDTKPRGIKATSTVSAWWQGTTPHKIVLQATESLLVGVFTNTIDNGANLKLTTS